jgi:mannose-6-phosphate isomerase-like protein (cupin superfamily)
MTIGILLLLALQQPPAQTPPARPPAATQTPAPPGTATPAPAPPRRVAPATATLEIKVVDRSGRPISNAHVVTQGPTVREETTDKTGIVTLKPMTPGNYRVRAEGDGFVALEKEITVRGAVAPMQVIVSLAAAPAPPEPEPKAAAPPPPPPPPPAAPALGPPGEPRTLSIPTLAEHSLGGRDPVKVFAIGCSGSSLSRLIVVHDAVPPGTNNDADETLYLVAGEATLTLGGAKEQAITPGWFAIVPRGTSYALEKKGKNPAILLSTVFGRPCGATSTAHQ